LNNGSVTNKATASADGTDSNQAQATVTANQNPALLLAKSADPTTYDAVGQVISYTFVVTNTGNISLVGPVSVADDQAGDESCPDVSTVGNNDANLDPGETISCTASYSITQADLNSGSVTNLATASADGTDSNQAQATVTAIQRPALLLAKSADPGSYDAVGEVITYTFTVTNTGNVSLVGPVVISDDLAADEICPAVSTVGNLDGLLDPGETISCTASYSITQADLNNGSVTNKASANADGTDSNQAEATVTANQNPALLLTKSADPQLHLCRDQHRQRQPGRSGGDQR